MIFLHFLTTNLLWTQGYMLLPVMLVVGMIGYIWYRPLCYGALLFLLFSLWFFRSPDRTCAALAYDKTVMVCPADGKVVDIQFEDVGYGFAQKIAISLSLWDAHVMWIPYAGTVSHMVYKPGSFTCALLPKSSLLNERNDLYIKTEHGLVMIRQIAGTIARRICCWVKQHDAVQAGKTYGMIRFGSRVELFLPASAMILVGVGQQVYGGQTEIARWQTSY